MDTVIALRQFAFCAPAELCLFLLFQSLEFPNQINLEFGTDPRGKFKCNILMGVSTAIASCLGYDSDSVRFLHPLFCAQTIAIQAVLAFNYVEFGIIKIGVDQFFPYTEYYDLFSIYFICVVFDCSKPAPGTEKPHRVLV